MQCAFLCNCLTAHNYETKDLIKFYHNDSDKHSALSLSHYESLVSIYNSGLCLFTNRVSQPQISKKSRLFKVYWYKIHLEMEALVVGTKQNKQAQHNAGRPDSLASLPDLSACLLCFVPDTSTCSLKLIFAVPTNSTSKAKQGRWCIPLISLFNMISM